MHETAVIEAAEKLYSELSESGLDVLLDDRDVRAGIKFKDADLLGTPLRVTLGMRNLKAGQVELKLRFEPDSSLINLQDATTIIREKVNDLYDSIK
jgi:prolyl-tRNA synthetase